MKFARLSRLGAWLSVCAALWAAGSTSSQSRLPSIESEPAALSQFRASVNGHVVPVMVRVKDERVPAAIAGLSNLEVLAAAAERRVAQQDALIASLPERGIRLWPMAVTAKQADGSMRTIRFRNVRLGNSFGAYVAEADMAKLRAHPQVRSAQIDAPIKLGLNKSVDYMLGTEFELADRRLAVYGATEELDPLAPDSEAPPKAADRIDGVEGQGMYTAIIDSGTDWRHPIFGGTGHTSPRPTIPGNEASPSDHQKIVYYYNLSGGEPDDDHGHGTHTASTSAGYRMDGDTPGQLGFGTGPDGNGIGPTLDGTTVHGVSPAASILGYKMCNVAGSCIAGGGVEFAIEDAVSPTALIPEETGSAADTGVAKPVADVLSMSLSGGTNPVGSSSVYSNNAVLAGAIVVAAASNSGPDASTAGAPCVGTLVMCIAASLDPGSIAAVDVLADGEVPAETNAGQTPGDGAIAGPPKETGPDSESNAPHPTERQAMKAFDAAGGGPLPGGSVSAHYVFADMRAGNNNPPPTTGTNRIILVRGTGAFATIANSLAPVSPAAILIITTVESATAVAVAGSIPTYTINPVEANYLIDLMRTGDEGDGDDSIDVPHGTVSELPMRVSASAALDTFEPAVAGFSGRGPRTDFRAVKPDISGPGVGIVAATTPEGNPSAGIGMASPSGYTSASGTSMSTPHVSGGMALIRQHVRENLGFDSTDITDPDYRLKRYDASMISRALAQNTATNLRNGRGVPEASDALTVHDIGSGHMDISGALNARAIMVATSRLTPDEFDAPVLNPPALHEDGSLDVQIPTYAYGLFAAAGAPRVVSKVAQTFIRDITAGGGAGGYDLTWENNLNTDMAGIAIDFVAADGETAITSVNVPNNGTAEFGVRISVDGTQFTLPNTDVAWYVTATHSSGRTLRMPFYFRSATYVSPLIVTSPLHDVPTDVESAATPPDCSVDNNSNYTLNFSYVLPEGGDTPVGFRIQEGTTTSAIFEDTADEPLVAGANSLWAGSEQWSSSTSPGTQSPAYFVPNAVEQNEALTMIDPVTLPASASLSFDAFVQTEQDFDYAIVELLVDGATIELARYTGGSSGIRTFDLSPWGGKDVRLQFRMLSDLLVNEVGFWIDDVRFEADDFTTIGEAAAGASTFQVTGRYNGTYFYRVAGLFDDGGVPIAGPYSDVHCVTIENPNVPPLANAGADFSIAAGEVVTLNGADSSDPDGTELSFQWTQLVGPPVTLDGDDTATASFTAPTVHEDTELTFELEVTDAGGLPATDTVTVTVLKGTTVGPGGQPKVDNNRFVVGSLAPLALLALGSLAAVRRRRPRR